MVAGADALTAESRSTLTDAASARLGVSRTAAMSSRGNRDRVIWRSRPRGCRRREAPAASSATIEAVARPRLLGSGLDPVPPGQDRDRERRCSSCCCSWPRSSARRSRRIAGARPERPCSRRGRSEDCCRWGRGRACRRRTRTRGQLRAARFFILGGRPTLGRDEFLRLLYGAPGLARGGARRDGLRDGASGCSWASIAGYFRGWIDTVVSRLTEITMAFPFLLFTIALASTVGDQLDNDHVRLPRPGVLTLVLIFALLRLVLPGADHARPGAVVAREGVHRGGAHGRARATGGSSARTCCRTSSRRSIVLSTLDRRRRTSSPRRASRSSGSGSSCRRRAGATCCRSAPTTTSPSRG